MGTGLKYPILHHLNMHKELANVGYFFAHSPDDHPSDFSGIIYPSNTHHHLQLRPQNTTYIEE